MRPCLWLTVIGLTLTVWPTLVQPATQPINVAVATNFQITAQQLADAFSKPSGDRSVRLISGSTGKLYAQILQGAPFDLFLAADQARPRLLDQGGRALAGSRRTYAVGRLALIGSGPVDDDTLRRADYRYLAIANPKLAPYGAAAEQTLRSLGLHDSLKDRLVYGENVGQAFAMVDSGNAELGLVSLAQLPPARQLVSWIVPPHLHQPIRQDMVLINRPGAHQGAAAFAQFMESALGHQIIIDAGYLTPHG